MRAGWWIGRAGASIGLGVFVVVVTGMVAHRNGRSLDTLDYLWLVAPAFALVARDRFPLTAYVVVASLTWSYYGADQPSGPMGLYPVVAAYALTVRRGPLLTGVVAGVLMGAWAIIHVLIHGTLYGGIAFAVAFTSVAIAAGAAVTARRNTMAARQEQAEERTRRLAEEERLRIAREVHDVVAHSLAMINVQAGVGAHVANRRPEEAKAALLAIKEASHTALADLRATLAVLRGTEDRAPAPSLRRLAELTDATTAAGLRVDVDGEPGELPAPVDSAAYRIVQESLTNAVRHARDATHIDVLFVRTNGHLEVTVRDDGVGSVDPGSGNGLRGMRERAEALGGTLVAGAAAGEGFRVRAVLPVRGDDS